MSYSNPYGLTWTTTDTAQTVTGFDSTLDDPYTYTMAISYTLYANEADWTTFESYYDTQEAAEALTTNEKLNLIAYNDYALRITCDLSTLDTPNGSACCLMD